MNNFDTFDFDTLSSCRARVFEPLKPRLQIQDMTRLFDFIWSHDSYDYDHPRHRIQVALALLLHFHFGLSPNIALSKGLRYGDVRILMTEKEGTERVVLFIDLNTDKRGAKWLER